MAKDAIALMIVDLKEDGKDIPEPSPNPAVPSGSTLVFLKINL